MRSVVVVDYDEGWPEAFERVRSRVWPAVSDVALAVEHVGSTSVPGLAAKPIIDVSVVVRGEDDVAVGIERLAERREAPPVARPGTIDQGLDLDVGGLVGRRLARVF